MKIQISQKLNVIIISENNGYDSCTLTYKDIALARTITIGECIDAFLIGKESNKFKIKSLSNYLIECREIDRISEENEN